MAIYKRIQNIYYEISSKFPNFAKLTMKIHLMRNKEVQTRKNQTEKHWENRILTLNAIHLK